jgi:CHAT domain-containing protein
MATQKVYELLTAEGDPQKEKALAAAAQELSQMVLAPLGVELNKPHIIVVADDSLNYIPFQFLSAPAEGEPLVANHEVINVPSASILEQLREETAQRHAPARALVAFGDPVFESNYSGRNDSNASEQIAALHGSQDEPWRAALRDIETVGDATDPTTIRPLLFATRELANLQAVAGPDTLLVTGFDATRENLEKLDLTKYAILHFATHGVLDPKRPEQSGLLLSMVDRNGRAQDGFVRLHDIYNLHAPVDLVVLSACRTGLGKEVRGEGLIGLTRGFMYAGASSVVASLWKVDDEATSELMKRFYTNMLQRGMTPAAALRAAQNSIRQEPQWRAPYFWAAFTLQGEYRQVIGQPSTRTLSRPEQMRLGAALVLLLLAVGGWWYRGSRATKV